MLTRVTILNEGPQPTARQGSSFETTLCLTQLRQEFPTVRVEETRGGSGMFDDLDGARIAVADWRGLTWDPEAFDNALLQNLGSPDDALCVIGAFEPSTLRAVFEILSRYQLLVHRTNTHSSTTLFNRILARHRELFDLSKPLVRSDYLHALDTWQWTLRLRPTASFASQVAALFHDLERFVPVGQATTFTTRLLSQVGVPPSDVAEIVRLTEELESPGHDAELLLVSDADCLSFLSLMSPRFLDYHGEAQTDAKATALLRRLRRESVPRLRAIKLRADVERVVVQALRRLGSDAWLKTRDDVWRDSRLCS